MEKARRNCRDWVLQGSLAGLLLLAGCGGPEMPPVPTLRLEGFQPAVREAIQKAQGEVRHQPKSAEANGRLGVVLHAYGQSGAAEACYRRAQALQPGRFEWTYCLGVVQAVQGRYREAADSFAQALRVRPADVPARLRRADALLAAGDLEGSGTLFASLAQERPEMAAAHYGVARIATAQGRSDDALRSLEAAVRLAPAYGAAQYGLALAYRKRKDESRAKEHFRLYETHRLEEPAMDDPLMAAVRRSNTGALRMLKQAVELEAEGRLAESATLHEQALAEDGRLEQGHVNLISLYGRLRQGEKAREHYEKAIQLNPHLADAHYNLGVLLYGQGELGSAEAAFRKALEIQPSHAEARNNLGQVLQQTGRLAEAEQEFRAAVDSRPDLRIARFHLGRLLVNRGRHGEAIEQFRLTLHPEDENTPACLYALGATYARVGQRRAALEHLRRAREMAQRRGQGALVASVERDLRSLR